MLDVSRIGDAITATGATSLMTLPSVLAQLLERDVASLRGLELAIVAGETCPPPLLAAVRRDLPTTTLVNEYGPAEAAVWCTSWSDGSRASAASPVPIGNAIPGVVVRVVDGTGNEVPVGVLGELAVSGPTLARGYLGRPALTAEAFRPDPHGSPGARAYRTGDLSRRSSAGDFIFEGRVDRQAKIRGHRVEPDDVAAVLRTHPWVADCYADVKAPGDAAPLLVAWIQPEAGWASEAVERELAARHQRDWAAVFDDAMNADSEAQYAGWQSAFDGAAFPVEEMDRWLERTMRNIAVPQGGRVLEIGCGHWLVGLRAATLTESYVGVDISASALVRFQRAAEAHGLASRVRLVQAAADDLDGVHGTFDRVVLNSVVQYFPGAWYLDDVLATLAAKLAPGGRIVVGDVRDLGAASIYFAEVAAHAGGHLADPAAAQAADRELLLHPAYFEAITELDGTAGERAHPSKGRAAGARRVPLRRGPAAGHRIRRGPRARDKLRGPAFAG